jgi:hypothetical protein
MTTNRCNVLCLLVCLACLLLGFNRTYLSLAIQADVVAGYFPTRLDGQDDLSSSSSSFNNLIWPLFGIRGEGNTDGSFHTEDYNTGSSDVEDDYDEMIIDECEMVTRQIRQRNDCALSPECRHAHSFEQLPQPLLNIAYFKGQGFGRLIEHSVETCLIAASVGRPCLVDMTMRDQYFTFRSFIDSKLDINVDALAEEYKKFHANEKTNRFDHFHLGNRPILEEETILEIKEAFKHLPKPELGHWTNQSLQGTHFNHVLPLADYDTMGHPGEAMMQNPHKVALSPNWGTSWFGQRSLKWPTFTPERTNETESLAEASSLTNRRLRAAPAKSLRHRKNTTVTMKVTHPIPQGACHDKKDERLVTYMQNYMYRPTPLLRELHKEHRKLILGTEKHNAAILPYGTIHLRFTIMRIYKTFPEDSQGPQAIDKALRDLAKNLYQCLQVIHQKQEGQAGAVPVGEWWLVTDRLNFGQNLTDYVNEESAKSSDTYQPQIFLETNQADKKATHPIIKKIALHRQNGEIAHSLDDKAISPMGHEFMASSMLDWMALHESKLSLITKGAFATTGARGNGKYKQELEDGERWTCRGFELFHA